MSDSENTLRALNELRLRALRAEMERDRRELERAEALAADNARLREALELVTPAPGFPKCDSRCSSNSHAYDEDNRCDCGMEEIRTHAEKARAALADGEKP